MNAELSRKRKHSVNHEGAQSSRGPQKGDFLNVRAPPKVRKLGVESKVSLVFCVVFFLEMLSSSTLKRRAF